MKNLYVCVYRLNRCRNLPRHVDFCNNPLKFHILDSCAVEIGAIEYGVLTCNIHHVIRYA